MLRDVDQQKRRVGGARTRVQRAAADSVAGHKWDPRGDGDFQRARRHGKVDAAKRGPAATAAADTTVLLRHDRAVRVDKLDG